MLLKSVTDFQRMSAHIEPDEVCPDLLANAAHARFAVLPTQFAGPNPGHAQGRFSPAFRSLAAPIFDSHPRSRTRYLGHYLCPKLQGHAHCDRQKEKLRFFDNDVGRLGHRTTLPERIRRGQASQPVHLTVKKVIDAVGTFENIEIETESAGSFYGVKITNKNKIRWEIHLCATC